MIKGFFFDLDGTLVGTHQANYQAYKKALDEFGVEIEYGEFEKTIGQQAQVFLPELAPKLNKDNYRDIAVQKAEYYKDFLHLSKLNTKLVQFLDMVAVHDQTVLVTTAKRANAEAVLRHHRLTDYFDHIVANEDVSESKPSPEAYNLALTKTGLHSSEAIAFEDSKVGREAAEAAGLSVIMVKEFIA